MLLRCCFYCFLVKNVVERCCLFLFSVLKATDVIGSSWAVKSKLFLKGVGSGLATGPTNLGSGWAAELNSVGSGCQ